MAHLIAGLILLGLGAWGILAWWMDFGAFFRGLIPFLLVLGGVAALGAGALTRQRRAEREAEFDEATTTDDRVHQESRRMAG